MRIKELISLPENHEIQADYITSAPNYEPMCFVDQSGEIVGYIWFYESERTFYIELIEMINKEEGYGTEAIQFLFQNSKIERVSGAVMPDYNMRPYWFWSSLGAEISEPPEAAQHNPSLEVYFSLYRESLAG